MSKEEFINRLRSELGEAQRRYRKSEGNNMMYRNQGKLDAYEKAIELAKQLD